MNYGSCSLKIVGLHGIGKRKRLPRLHETNIEDGDTGTSSNLQYVDENVRWKKVMRAYAAMYAAMQY